MKKLLLIYLLVIPLATTSQEVVKKPSVFSLGVSFSPEYSYRVLKATEDKYEWSVKYSDSLDKPKFGYTAGFYASHDILKQLTLETGIMFSDKGDKMTTSNFEALDPNDPLLLRLKSITMIKTYYYLEIPVRVSCRIVSAKLSVAIVAGISGNIFLDSKTKTIMRYNDGSPDEKDTNSGGNGNRGTVSVLAGIGLDYKLTDKLCIGFEPVYKRDITTVYSSDITKLYFYSFGANIGIKYRR